MREGEGEREGALNVETKLQKSIFQLRRWKIHVWDPGSNLEKSSKQEEDSKKTKREKIQTKHCGWWGGRWWVWGRGGERGRGRRREH